MANEIGYWNGGAGSVSEFFSGGDSLACVDTGLHTAGAGETITAVRFALRGTQFETSAKVALYATSAGVPTGSPIYTPVTIAVSGAGTYSSAVSWALTNGVTYALVFGEADNLGNLSSDTRTNGSAYDDLTGSLGTWSQRGYKANIIELAGDITVGGSTVTKTPAPAALAINPLAPSTNAFTSVAIRDTLINESGQPISSAANIRLMVWYSGQAIGAPDYSVNGLTTDPIGTISWSVAKGTLTNGQAIFYVAQDSISYSNYTCGRVVPTYG